MTIVFRRSVEKSDEVLNEGANEGVNEGVNEGINKAVIETYTLIKNNPGINTPQIVSLTGKGDATIERHIAVLKKKQMIEHRGSAKTGGYYVIENESKSN